MLRLTKVDELILPDHHYLEPSDDCRFLREYIPRVGYSGGETNNLVSNFKKPVTRSGHSDWHYKGEAILKVAKELANALSHAWLNNHATLVPIPPSKTKSNPLYDDRMTQVLNLIGPIANAQCDVRELIVQTEDMEAAHTIDARRSPIEFRSHYEVDERLTEPTPRVIGLFDDLLTTGAHFRAAKGLLQDRFPGVPVIGIFVARRIIPAVDWGAFPVLDS